MLEVGEYVTYMGNSKETPSVWGNVVWYRRGVVLSCRPWWALGRNFALPGDHARLFAVPLTLAVCRGKDSKSWKALEEFQGEAEASTWVLAVGVVRIVYIKETPNLEPTDDAMNDSDLLSI